MQWPLNGCLYVITLYLWIVSLGFFYFFREVEALYILKNVSGGYLQKILIGPVFRKIVQNIFSKNYSFFSSENVFQLKIQFFNCRFVQTPYLRKLMSSTLLASQIAEFFDRHYLRK